MGIRCIRCIRGVLVVAAILSAGGPEATPAVAAPAPSARPEAGRGIAPGVPPLAEERHRRQGSDPAPQPPPTLDVTGARAEMLALINAERVQAGVGPLRLAGTLSTIAQGRSQDMITRHYFSHHIPGGDMVFALLDRAHVRYAGAGENLARNNYLAFEPRARAIGDTNADLMHSPEHRANILEPAYTTLGLGLAVERGTDIMVLTEVFVQPAAGGTRAGGTPAA